jgi:chromosome segregation ATPase
VSSVAIFFFNQPAFSKIIYYFYQGDMESIMRNRELAETRMMQALREELATTERRAEEERSAHNATKMAAMERERELEHRAVDASTALVRIQRIADERTAKVADFEQKVALLEAECTSLNQELQDMEVRARRGQKKAPDEANQVIQIQAWQDEVDRARQGQRDAEEKLSLMEAEMQKLRVEMAAMKRDAEHYSRQVILSVSESLSFLVNVLTVSDFFVSPSLYLWDFLATTLFLSSGLGRPDSSLLNPLAYLFH